MAKRLRIARRPPTLRPHRPEELLIERVPELEAERILCTSLGLAQFAAQAARARPQARVFCHYLDLYRAQQAQAAQGGGPANLAIGCHSDFPQDEVDLVAIPLTARGEAELARDLLQAGHQRLRQSGQLWASTDNPRDTWLQEELEKLFGSVARRPGEGGMVYVARKTGPLKKVKSFAAEFAFRDHGRLFRIVSRPGVFSHRRIDAGTRQVMNAMSIAAGQRVLDIGCGSGALSLAAAARAEDVTVLAVDSNARAVACTAEGAQLNGLTNVATELNAAGLAHGQNTFDVALANPPYYAAFQIAEHFLRVAHQALKPGGQVLVVTKSPPWYRQHMPQWFEQVQVETAKDYYLVRGRKPRA